MKLSWGISTTILSAAILFAGCGGGDGTTKVAPQTIPDREPIRTAQEERESYDNATEEYSYEKPPLELLTINFEYDRYDLSRDALDILAANAEMLSKYPNSAIKIEGHCDERGTEEYNMALGENRARTVREYLLKYGIAPDQVSIISYGELRPAERGQDESAWRKNRRADFVVLSE